MHLHRFYCEALAQPTSELTGAEAHHLISVLRLWVGDKIELFDGVGGLAVAVVQTVGRKRVTLEIERLERAEQRTNGRIIIAASIAKGERFDWLIGKCTELGADRICPVIFERTVKLATGSRVLNRWENIAIASAKQCGRLFLPVIDGPMPLKQVVEAVKSDYARCRLVFGSFAGDAKLLTGVPFGCEDVAAFIGPEGGFASDEEQLLKKAGAEGVYLTETTLRVETAAVALAAILGAQRRIAK